jgi:hypothetical protein
MGTVRGNAVKTISIALAMLVASATRGVAQSPGAAAIDFRLKTLAGATVTLTETGGIRCFSISGRPGANRAARR